MCHNGKCLDVESSVEALVAQFVSIRGLKERSFGRSWTVAVCHLWCLEVLANGGSMLQMWAATQCQQLFSPELYLP